MQTLEILKKLNASFGPSGNESGISNTIKEILSPCGYEMTSDVMGNLMVHVPGNGPKLMFAAHMDSIGLIVTYIEKDGLLRFGPVGGVHAADILACPVRFANGTVGTVYMDDDAKAPALDKMFIDIGAKSEAEAKKAVMPGDMAVWDSPVRALGKDRVVSPYIDNRAGCAAQILAIEELAGDKSAALPFDTYFVFTVQEELGLRGAKPASFGVEPEYGIVVDTTLVDDCPKANHVGSSVLGGGAAVKIMDKSVVCHPEMVERLLGIAKKNKIKAQRDVLRAGGTDAGEIRKSGKGVWTGGVSVATRYIHSPQEVCQLTDIEDCGKLMAAFVKTVVK